MSEDQSLFTLRRSASATLYFKATPASESEGATYRRGSTSAHISSIKYCELYLMNNHCLLLLAALPLWSVYLLRTLCIFRHVRITQQAVQPRSSNTQATAWRARGGSAQRMPLAPMVHGTRTRVARRRTLQTARCVIGGYVVRAVRAPSAVGCPGRDLALAARVGVLVPEGRGGGD